MGKEVDRDLPSAMTCEAENQVYNTVSFIRHSSILPLVLLLFLKKLAGGLTQKTNSR